MKITNLKLHSNLPGANELMTAAVSCNISRYGALTRNAGLTHEA